MAKRLTELFISIDDFLVRSPEILDFLEPFDPNIGAIAVQASFCPEDGKALAVVVFDRKRRPTLARLAETFAEVGMSCFELTALSAPERDHFQRVELPRYTIRIEAANTLGTALGELLGKASVDELHPKVTEDDWPSGTPAEARSPLQVRPKKAPTAELGELAEALDTTFPPLDEDDEPAPDPQHPGGYARVKRAGRTTPGDVDVVTPAIAAPQTATERVLRVRFMRGERWLPGRIRYISNREVRIATAAPPRLEDVAVMGLSFEGEELFITGAVTSVEGLDGSVKSPGFSAQFGKLPAPKKTQLVELLRRARDAGVSLRPPPVRRARRFPVSWPVIVNANGRPERATALDVSWSGLYLDASAPVGSELLFALPLDVEAGAIRGRAVVVRAVDATQAAELQTSPGIGVAITHLGPGDDVRYRAFLERVRLRCARRVIVGAAPIRAQGLTRTLAAAGYAVTSSTNATALAELIGREVRPPDIAVIDDSLGDGARPALLRVFRNRNVPTLAIGGGESDHTRRVVDRILEVESGG